MLLVDDAFAAAVEPIRAAYPELTTVVFIGDGTVPDGMLGYEELLAGAEPIEDTRTGGDTLFGVFYTGGTTGHPKGVMLSHTNVLASAFGAFGAGVLVTPHGRLLHAAPMFHVADFALWSAGNLAETTHVIIPAFTPSAVLDAIQAFGVTDTILVPTMIQMLIDHPELDGYDTSSLRKLAYGASPITESVLVRARKALPTARFTQAYGMIELSPTATLLTPDDHERPELLRSAGRAAAHTEIRIVDAQDRELPRGEIGQIIVRGDNAMLGYWARATESAEALAGGWMHTGDAGRMDAEGYVFVVDRIKDMIITGGENVYCVEVENALAAHPAVAAVAVIGMSDEQWGERVHAVVVTRPGQQISEEALRTHCRTLIAGYKVPRTIGFVAALPVSGAGKVLKRQLRERV
ncbi:AMP-binding protein [Nocardia arthritidis]|uniref:AMP-binding protein n=1 Tax=Nocardia arthritidis TaxID=228602 RepID=A0A6G9YLB2_9NOCA|nr:AMP-binding protein [Nocardia arthritidis]